MTEAEWLASDDPQAMLAWLNGKPQLSNEERLNLAIMGSVDVWCPPPPSQRKPRLFACAVVAAVGRKAETDWAEAKAERAALAHADDPSVPLLSPETFIVSDQDAVNAAYLAAERASQLGYGQVAARLAREVFGNPFRHQSLVCEVSTGCAEQMRQARTVARSVYHEQRWEELPIVADALEDAGCSGENVQCPRCQDGSGMRLGLYGEPPRVKCHHCDGQGRLLYAHPLLAHLRSPDPHVRGCWALDLVLGKE